MAHTTSGWLRGAAAFLLGLSVGGAQAALIKWQGNFVAEATGATGSGSARVSYDTGLRKLFVDIDWQGLSGTTTVAHFHCCTPTTGIGAIGVAVTPGTLPGFPRDLNAGEYVAEIDLTNPASFTDAFVGRSGGDLLGARRAFIQGLDGGTNYLNLHTTAFPGGEVRTFFQRSEVIPAAPTALLALAGLGLMALRRRPQA